MSNYRNGADLERAARKSLEADGYYVIRSAGSKGVVDLAAFKPGEVLFVQCKLDGVMGPTERARFTSQCARVGAVPLIAGWHKEGQAARRVRFAGVLLSWSRSPEWTADHEPELTVIRAARVVKMPDDARDRIEKARREGLIGR